MFKFVNKTIEQYCKNCRATTEMKIERLESNLNIYWLKCKDCHTATMIKKETLETKKEILKSGKSIYQNMGNQNENKMKEYNPTETYKIGEKLYHSGFKDKGIVTKVMPGSGDYEKINVKFEKCGKKILIQGASTNQFQSNATIFIKQCRQCNVEREMVVEKENKDSNFIWLRCKHCNESHVFSREVLEKN